MLLPPALCYWLDHSALSPLSLDVWHCLWVRCPWKQEHFPLARIKAFALYLSQTPHPSHSIARCPAPPWFPPLAVSQYVEAKCHRAKGSRRIIPHIRSDRWYSYMHPPIYLESSESFCTFTCYLLIPPKHTYTWNGNRYKHLWEQIISHSAYTRAKSQADSRNNRISYLRNCCWKPV